MTKRYWVAEHKPRSGDLVWAWRTSAPSSPVLSIYVEGNSQIPISGGFSTFDAASHNQNYDVAIYGDVVLWAPIDPPEIDSGA